MSLCDLLTPPPPGHAEIRPWDAPPLRPEDRESGSTAPDSPRGDPEPPDPAAILQTAREEAAGLLEQAEEEAERLRGEAERAGLAAGLARGEAECRVERDRLRQLREEFHAAVARFCEAQTPVLAQLAAEGAEALLMEQLSLEPDRVLSAVRHALEQTVSAVRVTVHLHPDDLILVQSSGETPDSGTPRPSLEWRADAALDRGGCRIEGDHGEIDATVAGRVARFRAAFAAMTGAAVTK